jgi:hypothetical protein
MKKVNYKELDTKLHNIICAYTTDPDYEMSRYILLEDCSVCNGYIVVEGGHCSCYGFDETEWDAISYTADELEILANAEYNNNHPFWELVKRYLR